MSEAILLQSVFNDVGSFSSQYRCKLHNYYWMDY